MRDQQHTFVMKDYYDQHHEALTERLGRVERMIAWAAGAATVGSVLINFMLRTLLQ
jgi:hypothetical protein